jgi:hypothetical protein
MFYYLFLYDVTLKPEDLTKRKKKKEKNFHGNKISTSTLFVVGACCGRERVVSFVWTSGVRGVGHG